MQISQYHWVTAKLRRCFMYYESSMEGVAKCPIKSFENRNKPDIDRSRTIEKGRDVWEALKASSSAIKTTILINTIEDKKSPEYLPSWWKTAETYCYREATHHRFEIYLLTVEKIKMKKTILRMTKKLILQPMLRMGSQKNTSHYTSNDISWSWRVTFPTIFSHMLWLYWSTTAAPMVINRDN